MRIREVAQAFARSLTRTVLADLTLTAVCLGLGGVGRHPAVLAAMSRGPAADGGSDGARNICGTTCTLSGRWWPWPPAKLITTVRVDAAAHELPVDIIVRHLPNSPNGPGHQILRPGAMRGWPHAERLSPY